MEISIIKIGKSKGILIPNEILKQYNIGDKVEMTLEENHIILRPIEEPRTGWDKAFKKLHENGDDNLLITDVFEDESFEDLG
ncbi:AbrB/MazE/SpoVT family DNA-binding domain-containing protein [Brumimicrobium glaciale]|uniref:AbrB/MazE/SpoVT family DNA-binding domain-containing protein n=1 Tax=Brumimicrobium glaciale TaxID=200475 RepID=A0A4Q4KS32_9FLAO|nr:AbrB/MazE/SpoVT family DNA-binding domain-containing protein [Brumimicrobium glaciale]RYM34839.1 AbrB/MazE/SpoVT family DNA-binding domain-containing protein [Brumimicrobium glaciale]